MNTTTFHLSYNRTTVHISGLTETTKASADGMTYAQSACPVLTRSVNFCTVDFSDDLATTIQNAELYAHNHGLKVCKNCAKAADKQLKAEAVAETTPEPETVEIVAEVKTQRVALLRDEHLNERVHSAECRDVKVEATKYSYDPYFLDAATREDVARDWYGDCSSDHYEVGTPEWEQDVKDSMNMAMTFLPCCQLPSEDQDAPTATQTASQAPEAQDAPEATGEPVKKLGKAQRRVLEFLKARPGQTMVVSLIVSELAAQGIKTWFRATNDALAKLSQDPTSGIVEITGGNKAYMFKA